MEQRATVCGVPPTTTDPIERAIVANADQLVIVTALADPAPRPRLIDRCLVAAYDADVEPLLCLTKSDLASPEDLLDIYRPLGVQYVVTRHDEELGQLVRERLRGPGERPGRSLGSRQVDAGQRPGPGRAPRRPARSTRSPAGAGTPRRRR